MMRTRFLILAGLLTLAAAPGCIIESDEDADDSTLLIVNDSDYEIWEVYLAEVGTRTWGRNLLGADYLAPGEELLIVDIECDYYDALLIDEDDVECELLDVDLCFDDATWYIRNNTCDIFAADGEATKKAEATRVRPEQDAGDSATAL